jgi:glycosyltransferase involved in cell wall biosynthesis
MRTVDIVVPAYNEAKSIRPLYERVFTAVGRLPYAFRLIFVDDGSTDATAAECAKLAEADRRVGLIQLSRNFGHQAALTAAIDAADADAVITMDADLQHPPEAIPDLIAAWEGGAELVHAVRRRTEADGLFKRLSSLLFYRMMRLISEVPVVADAPDFRLLDRNVVRAIRGLREQSRFLRGMFAWLGFRQVTVPYSEEKRHEGRSKYGPLRMFAFALSAVLSFSRLPLRIAIVAGTLVSLCAFVYGGYAAAQHIIFARAIPGWTSLAVIISLLSGAQMLFLGVVGEYLGQVHAEAKHRPLYVVRQTSLPEIQTSLPEMRTSNRESLVRTAG